MKKIILSLVILMSMTVVMNAQQTTMTMRGFTAGGATIANSYGAFGQPFATIATVGNNHELSEGVAQMQVVYDTVYAVINYGADYKENGFNLPAGQTESHKDSVYLVNGGEYNYDLMRTLYLIVCPGPDSVKDEGGNVYNTVAVSGYCWTKENLRFQTGNQMTYKTQQHPDVDTIKYGYLYTWADASNNGAEVDGYVQGICPSTGWGWHLPNNDEIVALFSNPSTTLRSETEWQNSEVNTNSTKFTAYPAGEFSSELNRFQGMGTETNWWTAIKDGETFAHVIQLNNYCGIPMMTKRLVEDGLSVRCVMYNNWKALDEADAVTTSGN